MHNLNDLFKNLRRLDLKDKDIQDSLYRISDWLSNEEHTEKMIMYKTKLTFYQSLYHLHKKKIYTSFQ